ncbi:MAG TPA: hypothetical protein VIT23_06905 [Terrimicrobiaceae bacterium]
MSEFAKRIKGRLVQAVANLTPSCHEITRLLSDSMERRPPICRRILIRLHFGICIWCRRYGDQLKYLRRYSAEFSREGSEQAGPALSFDARERIKKALHEPDQ